MILVDRQITELCQGIVPEDIQAFYSNLGIDLPGKIRPMVEPFDPSLVNPASLDIQVGYTAKRRDLKFFDGYKDIELCEDFWIAPGDRILAASLETINLPNFICAQFRLKSSRGREWYEHMEAGYCDPGWNGSKLTMEIINMDLDSLRLYPGLKMGQLVFSLTFGLPRRSYALTGRYNGDRQVAQSKG